MSIEKKGLPQLNTSALALAAEGKTNRIADLSLGIHNQLTRDVAGITSFVESMRSSPLQKYIEDVAEQQKRLSVLLEDTMKSSALLEFSKMMADATKPYNDLVKIANSIRPTAFDNFAKAMQKQQSSLAAMELVFKPMMQDYSEKMRQFAQPAENLQNIIDSIRPLALEQFAKQMSGPGSSAFLKAVEGIVREEGLRAIYQDDDLSFKELDDSDIQDIEKEIESIIENPEVASQLSSYARKVLWIFFIFVIWPTIHNLSVSIVYDTWISEHDCEIDVKELARHMKSELAPELLTQHRLVKGENLRLRDKPAMKSEIIALLSRGTLLQIIDSTHRSWLLVEVEIDDDIITGWVSRRYTQRLR